MNYFNNFTFYFLCGSIFGKIGELLQLIFQDNLKKNDIHWRNNYQCKLNYKTLKRE